MSGELEISLKMNHQDLYQLLQTVQKNVRCPQCGRAYDFGRMEIRGIMDSVIFLELNCKNHLPLLATVALSRKNRKTGMVQKEKINSNDVIETYNFLKNFSGSFEQIFKNNN